MTKRKQIQILVVDDLPDWRVTLSGMLAEAGYTTQAAADMDEALALSASDYFNAALLDIRLSETDETNTDGLELAAKLRQRFPKMPIAIITGYGTSETIRRAIDPGPTGARLADDFIKKTEVDTLVSVITEV